MRGHGSRRRKTNAMTQEKRFGKRVSMPSTVQIIRELKIMMRHDAELAGLAVPAAEPGHHVAQTPVTAMSHTGSE